MVTHSRYRPPPTIFDRITNSLSVKPEDGIPNVTDLPSDVINQSGAPYMRRYFLLGPTAREPGSTARYHNILQSDLQHLHDHPWNFVSIIISGTYIETTPTTEQEYRPGSVLIRNAEQQHRLHLPSGPVWTFVLVGPVRRQWGFQTDDGWVHSSVYLRRQT